MENGEKALLLYRHIAGMPRCGPETPESKLPKNGIYLFFERGETVEVDGHSTDRIVRVGTHNEDNRFPSRIRHHYHGNIESSIFRKHVWSALCAKDPSLSEYASGERERTISRHMSEHFTFVWFPVEDARQRLRWEEGLIGLLVVAPLAGPSQAWLGHWARSAVIRRAGIWNVRGVDAQPISCGDLSSLLNGR